jgi:putative transposase
MHQSYTRLYYHIIFSTKNHESTITPEVRPRLYDYLGGLIRAESGILLSL